MRLNTLGQQARILRNCCRVRDFGAAVKMVTMGVHPDWVRYHRKNDTYLIPELNISLSPAQHVFLSGLRYALELKRVGVSFHNSGNEIVAKSSSFSVAVENEDELFILAEVLATGMYNLLSASRDAIVLDVGMNVGIASLHFASKPWVREVWSYEPVPETYSRALRNLERNPELAAKIKPHNYGLSDKAGHLTFDFSPLWRGGAGIHGMPGEGRKYYKISPSHVTSVTVQVRGAAEVVRAIRQAYPRAQVIMKLDCEGSEYAILEDLGRAGLLTQFDAFLIEWHQRGCRDIERLLTNAGFLIVSLNPHAPAGMLYACRVPSVEGAVAS